MTVFRCTACGYEYDPAEHDNVAFEDLPEDWVCPLCGVGKDEFELVWSNLSFGYISNYFHRIEDE